MICRADEHYLVVRRNGIPDNVLRLRCMRCEFLVNVPSLHKVGDRSGQGRYNRARGKMVKHWHTEHLA